MYVLGSVLELGAGQIHEAKEMEWCGGGNWSLHIEISSEADALDYQYVLVDVNGVCISEPWKRKRRLKLDGGQVAYCLYDSWRLEPNDLYFYTSAFTTCLFAHDRETFHTDFNRKLTLKVCCPRVEKNQRLAITGNQSCIGFWNPNQSDILYSTDFPEWEVCLNVDDITFPLAYKFFVCDSTGDVIHWEHGENRVISSVSCEEGMHVIVHDHPYRDSRPEWKGVGTVVPVFSLRSERSFGVGDFHDLKLLIDWAVETHQQVVQVLPMNDTTRTYTQTDSYPYSAISIYALHPIYVSLSDLHPLHDAEKVIYFEEKRVALNENECVHYDDVMRYKMQYLRVYFEQEKGVVLQQASFQDFLTDNLIWLMPYAAFCYYRDMYQTADFSAWSKDAVYEPVRIRQLCDVTSDAYPDILFIYFLQFVLFSQFKSVSDYARRKGIVLKGDLPIGVNRMSVEAWTEPVYFNMAEQAGAPPDDFSAIGQNWSFPTYNWDVMERDGYAWWKNRFRTLGDYYDCFRIDHILGFFRIWEIPIGYTQGLCGHFRPALPFRIAEIEAYGFRFDDRYTRPRIQRRFLIDLFGKDAEYVMNTYLSFADTEHLVLRSFCDTQRKIEQLFHEKTGDMFMHIKNGLLSIANEVLFLPDPYEPFTYHPRIAAYHSFAYQELTADEQNAFNRLSNYFFYERHNEFWKSEALKRLTSLISSTDMLICGEDLGMIPKSVHEVMGQLHILSLELERAPKVEGVLFSDLQTLPYLSVCTTSTHDMNPLRNWWKEDRDRTQMYYQSVLHCEGKAPGECSAGIAKQVISNHLCASSMLAIIPLQDWLAMSDSLKRTDIEQERINIPADPHHYWRYRMHLSLEELLRASDFNAGIKKMLFDGNR